MSEAHSSQMKLVTMLWISIAMNAIVLLFLVSQFIEPVGQRAALALATSAFALLALKAAYDQAISEVAA